ncbi:MAG: thioredoxin domain-containing protein [Leptospiraceae bacterium]|nr:thioredoxin domain-containing protein [Leptospiraceae bacterium]MDW7975627.1 thioredoxin domain-containing protein [Leptospiraceae bacterium]
MKTRIILILLVFVYATCKEESVYVKVGGDKLTEEDVKKAFPEQFKQIRKQYEDRVRDLLVELAHQRMFEQEAKEKGLTIDQYIQRIQDQAPNPTEQEVEELYKRLVQSGQVKEQEINKEDFKFRLFSYLKQEKAQEEILKEVARLKQKYKFYQPVERFEVNIKGDPYRGNPNAKIVIVEFSDFECPFCLKSQKTSRQLREKYGDKIKWVFKDFPLDFHALAMDAHKAAKCVYRLKPEKFWDYFDALFKENRTKEDLKLPSLEQKAMALGISKTELQNCMKDPKIEEEIQNNIKEGTRLGVTGTPAFFINGRKISGAVPITEFETIIQEELTN